MNSALCQITTTHKNKLAYAKTLLIGTRRVLDFWTDPLGAGTELYYLERNDRQVPAPLFKVNMTSEALHALLLESENEQWIYIQVEEEMNVGNKKKIYPSVEVRRVNIEQIIWGYDIDTTSSYLFIDRGPFGVWRLKTTHTIDEIDNIASESFSISVS